MATKHVLLPEIGEVTLYKRKGNHSLKLSIGNDGEIRVSMPYWLPYKAGEQFAYSKSHWIVANLPTKQQQLVQGHGIGKAHRINFIFNQAADTIKTHVGNNEIRIYLPSNEESSGIKAQSAAQKASVRALRKEAERLLPQRLHTLSNQTGLKCNSVSVKQLKSRWGSCSNSKDIILNLYLMQLPWHLIDYVLVHELTHTKVMRHGHNFWLELEKHIPNAKELKKEINTYHPILSPGSVVVA